MGDGSIRQEIGLYFEGPGRQKVSTNFLNHPVYGHADLGRACRPGSCIRAEAPLSWALGVPGTMGEPVA